MILDMTEDTSVILPPNKRYLTVVNRGTEELPATRKVIHEVKDWYQE